MQENSRKENNQERPPLFRSWPAWYAFVLFFLVFQIGLYYFITQAFK